MGEAPDVREQEDCPSGSACGWLCDQHDPFACTEDCPEDCETDHRGEE